MHIKQIGYALPKLLEPLAARAQRLNIPADYVMIYNRIYGIDQLPYDPNATVNSLLSEAVHNCLNAADIDVQTIKWLISSQTLYPNVPYGHNHLQKIKENFGLQQAHHFATNADKCASIAKACQLAQILFESDECQEHILIVTADITDEDTRQLSVTGLETDSAAAVLFSRKHHSQKILYTSIAQYGQYSKDFFTKGNKQDFEERYPTLLAQTILRAAQASNKDLKKVRWIFAHHASHYSWRKVANILNYPFENIYLKHAATFGHCFGADPWINFALATKENLLNKGDLCILVTVGLGASFSAMVVEV